MSRGRHSADLDARQEHCEDVLSAVAIGHLTDEGLLQRTKEEEFLVLQLPGSPIVTRLLGDIGRDRHDEQLEQALWDEVAEAERKEMVRMGLGSMYPQLARIREGALTLAMRRMQLAAGG